MPRSDEQNRRARERARESILDAAVAVISERGVSGASIAEITRRAGVAQGLVNYHFGSKDQLIAAIMDRWFDTLFGLPQAEGSPDEVLAGIIDAVIMATAFALPLQRAVVAMQQQPATHRLFAESEARHSEAAVVAEDIVRGLFAARGSARPDVDEIMLRTTLEGIVMKYSVYGDTFPLEAARRWVYRAYELPEPAAPLPLAPGPEGEIRMRALAAVREALPD